jgi:hypothetical protein
MNCHSAGKLRWDITSKRDTVFEACIENNKLDKNDDNYYCRIALLATWLGIKE